MYPRSTRHRPVVLLAVFVAASALATSTITVEPGDTLGEIGLEHDVSIAELVEWNDLADPDRILAGATLIIAMPKDTAGGSASSATSHYTVAAGDTLSVIAARFAMSTAALARANGIADPDRIFAGQRLSLRVEPSPTPAPAATQVSSTYRVRLGDTLSAIAARVGVRVAALAAANDITDPDRIIEGQLLIVDSTAPAPTPTTTSVPPPTTTAPPPTTTAPPAAPTTTAPPPTTTAPTMRGGDVLLSTLFAKWADAYDVPRDLLEAIAWKESDWRPDAVGAGGHLGITQLSPDTVTFIETGLLGRDMDPLDASDGLQMAARYLRYVLDRTADEREAVAAWNQGLRSVQTQGITAAGAAYADAVLEIRRQRG